MIGELQSASITRVCRRALAWFAIALMFAFAAGTALAAEDLVRLPTRSGVTEPFWVMTPSSTPVGSIILFTGGTGVLGSARRPALHSNNFLIRSREKFAAAGFLVASVDAPSDQAEESDTFRSSAEHATDIAAVIAYLRQRAAVPVWLIGTSKGTISAANAAARLKNGGADGLVLTSSMVAQTRRVVPINASVDVAAITLPTLFVHNREDACPACAFSAVPALMDRFANARKKALIADRKSVV